MLKVFLVEDEQAMRERMKKNINWEEHGFLLVGEAGDGELAYPMISELKPDIVLTDIKMPFMNGLQLTRLIREKFPNIKVLILSGYDEFDYAKEAIGLGVTDYLLKPISSKKIIEALTKVATLIESERSKEQDQINHESQQNLLLKKYFNHLISGRYSAQELIEESKKIGIEILATNYQLMILKVTSVLEEEGLREKFADFLKTYDSLMVCEREIGDYLILIKGSEFNSHQFQRHLKEFLNQDSQGACYIGEGECVNRLSELSFSYRTANRALAQDYLLKNETKTEMMNVLPVEFEKVNKKELERFLYEGQLHEVSSFTKSYCQKMKTSINSYLFRQYFAVDLYFMLTSFCQDLNISAAEIFKSNQNLSDCLEDENQFKKMMEHWLIQCLMLRDATQVKGYGKLIGQVKAYLQANFNKEGLSLNQVALHVNMSASHLSMLFSQETNQTFISYLTQLRMEKAKELLRTTNLKTLEIGYEVGYKDPHYFSSLFKKTQHCTPKEYRSLKHDVD